MERGPGSMEHGAEIRDQGAWSRDQEAWSMEQESGSMEHEARIMEWGPGTSEPRDDRKLVGWLVGWLDRGWMVGGCHTEEALVKKMRCIVM